MLGCWQKDDLGLKAEHQDMTIIHYECLNNNNYENIYLQSFPRTVNGISFEAVCLLMGRIAHVIDTDFDFGTSKSWRNFDVIVWELHPFWWSQWEIDGLGTKPP